MAGESTGGTSGGGAIASGATRSSEQSGGTVGGFFSELFLGTDIHRNQQAHKRHVQQKRVAWWERQAQIAELAARAAAAGPRVAVQAVRTPGILRNLPGTAGPPPAAQPQQQPAWWEVQVQRAVELALLIEQWVRDRKAARARPGAGATDWSWLAGLIGPQGGNDVAYVYTSSPGLTPGYGITNYSQAGMGGGIWSGIGSALGQIASSALGNLAMPGGAPIPGLGVPFPTGIAAPSGGSMPAVLRQRAPAIIAVGGKAYRSLGTPLAWSGDLAAVKRLKRAAARIGHVVPRRGGGRRFR